MVPQLAHSRDCAALTTDIAWPIAGCGACPAQGPASDPQPIVAQACAPALVGKNSPKKAVKGDEKMRIPDPAPRCAERLSAPLTLCPPGCGAHAATLDEILAGPQRDPANAARDVCRRHPGEHCSNFFGVDAGLRRRRGSGPGGGWYGCRNSRALSAGANAASGPLPRVYHHVKGRLAESVEGTTALADKLSGNPLYDHVVLTELGVPGRTVIAPPGRSDFVLTFRNAHNWLAGGYAPGDVCGASTDVEASGRKCSASSSIARRPATSIDAMKKTGHMTGKSTSAFGPGDRGRLQTARQFRRSMREPKDTTDHPEGVLVAAARFAACANRCPKGRRKTPAWF
jgi:predicted methyltransferase